MTPIKNYIYALILPIFCFASSPFRADEKPDVIVAKPNVLRPAPQRPDNPRQNPTANAILENVHVFKDIEYAKPGARAQSLDVFVPKNATGKMPLIIWIHGGGWINGNKENCPVVDFTARGYVVASINYRLSGAAIFPAQIIDCKSAIRFLRVNAEKYQIDPNHVGVWGSSAGGHLAALVGTTGDVKEFDQGDNLSISSKVQAVVDYFGPTDFLKMDSNGLPDAKMKHDIPTSPESRLIGGPITENKDKVAKANPITYITKDTPPFYIAHGDRDPTVAPNQSQLIHDALKAANVPADLYWVKGAGHGGPQFFARGELKDAVTAFWDKHLKVVEKH